MFRFFALLCVATLILGACTPGMLNSDPDAMPTAGERDTPQVNSQVKPQRAPLEVGDLVPQFILRDQMDRSVSAGELTVGKGNVILFLGEDGAPSNRPSWQWARRNKSLLRQRGMELLLISPETVARNAQISDREDAAVALLSDPNSWVARGFGIVPPHGSAPTQPWVFVLGGNARVQYVEGSLPSATDLLIAAETQPGKEDNFFFSP